MSSPPYQLAATGLTGFLGSALVPHLRERFRDDELIHLGRRSIEELPHRMFDLADPRPHEPPVRARRLVHLAASISDGGNERLPERWERSNGRGTLALIESMDRSALRRVVHASSAHLHSGNPPRLSDPYEASKRSAELMLDAYRVWNQLSVVHLRFGYLYGAGMNHGGMIRTFVERALRDDPITLYNDGEDRHYLLHRADALRAIRSAIEEPKVEGALDIVPDRPVTTRVVAETVLRVTDSDSELVPAQGPDHPSYRKPDGTRARDVLGFETTVDLEDGIRAMVRVEHGAELARTS